MRFPHENAGKLPAETDRTSRLATWLCELRESRGVSQEALADSLGLGQSIVSRVERGHRRVTVPELLSWAEALGVSWGELSSGLRELWHRSASDKRP